jgi:predicted lipid-binding transport protein (Tim44 family)
MLAILVLVLIAIVALTVLGFAVHVLFSPWLLLAVIGILAWVKFRPRRSRQQPAARPVSISGEDVRARAGDLLHRLTPLPGRTAGGSRATAAASDRRAARLAVQSASVPAEFLHPPTLPTRIEVDPLRPVIGPPLVRGCPVTKGPPGPGRPV